MVKRDAYSRVRAENKGRDKPISVVLIKAKIAEVYFVSATTTKPFGLLRGRSHPIETRLWFMGRSAVP